MSTLLSRLKPSNILVKNALSSHSWLGLCVGALMYLVCLSGALLVFFEEFERWEQPGIQEYQDYSIKQIELAIEDFLSRVEKVPSSLYVVLPTTAVPRIHISGDEQEWFVNRDGSLSDSPVKGWTHMLAELHIYLHLPHTVGLIVVGILGVMLCSLIFSGLVAHPRIFKDAFCFRLGGSKQTEQVDIHNRLSVWGTPFYLIIGATGAFIGLLSVMAVVAAPAFFAGDREAVVSAVYGDDPILQQPVEKFDYARAFSQLQAYQPDAKPIYLVLQNLNTQSQFLEVAATLPQRLIYSEMYRFKPNGDVINHQGLSDGSVGRQIAYSVYRLHFGHFGGFAVKVIYAILGLALAFISASGINIWLIKRKHSSYLNHLWVAIVWGTPLALVLAALASFWGFVSIGTFWISLMCMGLFCVLLNDTNRSRQIIIRVLPMALTGLLFKYIHLYGWVNDNTAALGVNIFIVFMILGFGGYSLWRFSVGMSKASVNKVEKIKV